MNLQYIQTSCCESSVNTKCLSPGRCGRHSTCPRLFLFGQREEIKSNLISISVHYFHLSADYFLHWFVSGFLKVLEMARSADAAAQSPKWHVAVLFRQHNKWNEASEGWYVAVLRRRCWSCSVPDGLGHVVGRVSWQSVVEVPDEVISVLLRQSHEGPAHHDELHLVHTVTELLQLHITSHDTNTNTNTRLSFTTLLAVIESKVVVADLF